jgi:succinate dehydrogenase / fumarate reductase, membrane anchor subunit
MSARDRGLGSGGLWGWFMQRITGLLLVPVVLAHLLVTHYVLGNPTRGAFDVDYANVAERLANPWWKLIDLLFLGIVLFHGLRGVLVVINEGVHRPWLRVTLFCAALALGVVLAILGTVTILPFAATAAVR